MKVTDNTSGDSKELQFDLIVGCDGAGSAMRQSLAATPGFTVDKASYNIHIGAEFDFVQFSSASILKLNRRANWELLFFSVFFLTLTIAD